MGRHAEPGLAREAGEGAVGDGGLQPRLRVGEGEARVVVQHDGAHGSLVVRRAVGHLGDDGGVGGVAVVVVA